jgi:hypothetical protein
MVLALLKQFFSGKSTKKHKIALDKLKTGQAIEVRFHDPKTLGFINQNELSYTRLNPDELEDRTIQGIVEHVTWEHDIGHLLKVATFQIRENKPLFRSYLFLEGEIEYVRVLK